MKEHKRCIDDEGQQRCPKQDGDGKGGDCLVGWNTETTAETRVAKISKPSAEDAENGATDDVTWEMHSQIDARVAVENCIQHHGRD